MLNENEVVKELKAIKMLLAQSLVKDYETNKEKILYLNKLGFEAGEIAKITNTTPNTVSVTLYQSKNKKKPKNEQEVDK